MGSDQDGDPPLRGPWPYLVWLLRRERRLAILGALFGSTWMVSLALPPALLALAIDAGLRRGGVGDAVWWGFLVLAAGVGTAALAILRHRTMTKLRIASAARTMRVAAQHSIDLGSGLSSASRTGEVVAIGSHDAWIISQSLTVIGPGVGAVIGYSAVTIVLFWISPLLALVVGLGVPALALALGPILGRFQRSGVAYRQAQAVLGDRVVDIVAGPRVLSGLGGKDVFLRRFDDESARLEAEGTRVAAFESWIRGVSVGVPAVFLAVVLWLSARMAAAGAISIGELVAVFGYVAVLAVPVAQFIEGAVDLSQAMVAARRVITFLAMTPRSERLAAPDAIDRLAMLDPVSGVRLAPGELTVVATRSQADAIALVDRLGEVGAGDPDTRRRILVLDNDAHLFAGTLRTTVAGAATPDDAALQHAMAVSGAEDLLERLPGGWDSPLIAGGVNLSGGQRQRVRLARAIVADPQILIAVDPLSALDASTEQVVVARLAAERRGRATLITSTSPVLLGLADSVQFVAEGRVVASGRHDDLMQSEPEYRRLVERAAGEGGQFGVSG